MRVLCRLFWEEESSVSTEHDNSPAGNTIWFYLYICTNWQSLFCESLNELYIRDFLYSSWSDFCDWSNLLFSLGINYASLFVFIWGLIFTVKLFFRANACKIYARKWNRRNVWKVKSQWRVYVKVEPRSTFTFTCDLLYIVSILFTRVST